MDLGPMGGLSMEIAGARLNAALGGCTHTSAVPVEISTGETVAWLCPTCGQQLPADWERPQSIYGTLLHSAGIGINTPIVAVLNRLTGEFVPCDPPLYAAIADIDRVVGERQRQIEAEWSAQHSARGNTVNLADIPDEEWERDCRELDAVFPGLDLADYSKADAERALVMEQDPNYLFRPMEENDGQRGDADA